MKEFEIFSYFLRLMMKTKANFYLKIFKCSIMQFLFTVFITHIVIEYWWSKYMGKVLVMYVSSVVSFVNL